METILDKKKSQRDNHRLLILFFLWPFLAFLKALRSFERKGSRWVVYLFFILYGFTFTIISEGPDAARYAEWLADAAKMSFADYFNAAHGLHIGNICFDFVQPLMTFIMSRLTEDHRFLFAVFAAFFGWFYLKSISFIYDQCRPSRNVNALVHLLFFACIIPIFHINGVRFWTAAWVFFYGGYHVLFYKRKKYFLVCLFASFVHFGFLAANAVLLIYLVLGNRNVVYFPLFIISLIVSGVLLFYMKEIAPFLGEDLEWRIGRQLSEAAVANMNAGKEMSKWFVFGAGKLVLCYLSIGLFAVRHRYGKIAASRGFQDLFSFTLLFLSFVNFSQGIPSMGVRFQTVAFLFVTAYIALVFARTESKKWSWITLVGLFPMLLFSGLGFRLGFESLNPLLFAPMPLPLVGEDVTLGVFYDWFKKALSL